ncbi:hypothetical protein ACS0TY_022170 [Phlomoides rotata]
MSDSGGSMKWQKANKVIYDPKCDHKSLILKLGMRFENIEQCRKAVQRVVILSERNLNILRSSKQQLEVICVDRCPFRLYASVIHREQVVCIKTLVHDLRCTRETRNRQATAVWLAEEYTCPCLRQIQTGLHNN